MSSRSSLFFDGKRDSIYIDSTVTIGRSNTCTVSFPSDPRISGTHCRIKRQGGFLLEDLSSNGTYVNGQLLGKGKSKELQEGDRISLLSNPDSDPQLPKDYVFTLRPTRPIEERFQDLADDYELGQELGRGSFATVRKVVSIQTGDELAMKIVDKRNIRANAVKLTEALHQEASILEALDHQNIVKFYDFRELPKDFILILELVRGGDLFDYIKEKGPLPELVSRRIFQQLLTAVNYLHMMGYCHRDLKPENILLVETESENPIVKLTDFGLAKVITEGFQTRCGTPHYLAPEVQDGKEYSQQCDTWSLGVILYVMLHAAHPWGEGSDSDQLRNICLGAVQWDPTFTALTPTAKDMISKLLIVDPDERISAQDALSHPWILGMSEMPSRVRKHCLASPKSTPSKKSRLAKSTSPDSTL